MTRQAMIALRGIAAHDYDWYREDQNARWAEAHGCQQDWDLLDELRKLVDIRRLELNKQENHQRRFRQWFAHARLRDARGYAKVKASARLFLAYWEPDDGAGQEFDKAADDAWRVVTGKATELPYASAVVVARDVERLGYDVWDVLVDDPDVTDEDCGTKLSLHKGRRW